MIFLLLVVKLLKKFVKTMYYVLLLEMLALLLDVLMLPNNILDDIQDIIDEQYFVNGVIELSTALSSSACNLSYSYF